MKRKIKKYIKLIRQMRKIQEEIGKEEIDVSHDGTTREIKVHVCGGEAGYFRIANLFGIKTHKKEYFSSLYNTKLSFYVDGIEFFCLTNEGVCTEERIER